MKTAKELLANAKRLSFGCDELDKATNGGIPFFPVTEIAGEAGVGKTQLLLGLALTCQLSTTEGGLGGGCLYLSTEGPVPIARLQTYLQERPDLCEKLGEKNALDGVLIEDRIPDAETLWRTLCDKLPIVLSAGHIKLVIIDSIAAVFRGEFSGRNGMQDRNGWYFGLSNIMKRLHADYDCMFVLANQVSSRLDTGENVPALGLSWASSINQRFFIEFSNDSSSAEQSAIIGLTDVSPRRRVLSVQFSPCLPCGVVKDSCVVSRRGFHALPSPCTDDR